MGTSTLIVTDDTTMTMPSATDTLVGRASTDTLSNKTISGLNVNTAHNNAAFGGNIGYNLALAQDTTMSGTNQTATVLRFLNAAGTLLGNEGLSGILSVYVFDTATGGNAYTATYQLLSNGNGTANANLTIIGSANIRGTNPVSSITLADDGAVGAVKLNLTNASSGISGANVSVAFNGIAV